MCPNARSISLTEEAGYCCWVSIVVEGPIQKTNLPPSFHTHLIYLQRLAKGGSYPDTQVFIYMSQLGPWSNGVLMTMGEDTRVGECSVLEMTMNSHFICI